MKQQLENFKRRQQPKIKATVKLGALLIDLLRDSLRLDTESDSNRLAKKLMGARERAIVATLFAIASLAALYLLQEMLVFSAMVVDLVVAGSGIALSLTVIGASMYAAKPYVEFKLAEHRENPLPEDSDYKYIMKNVSLVVVFAKVLQTAQEFINQVVLPRFNNQQRLLTNEEPLITEDANNTVVLETESVALSPAPMTVSWDTNVVQNQESDNDSASSLVKVAEENSEENHEDIHEENSELATASMPITKKPSF